MALTETNIVNAFETTLAAQLASGGTTMNLTDDPGVAAPAYFVIAPDSDSAREVIKWDSGAYNNASVTRDLDSKHGTDPTHASGTTVRLAVVKQHIEDTHDRINDIALTGDVTGTISSSTQDIATSIGAGVIVDADINASAAIDATKIADGSVTSTEFQYIGGLTSDAQTQLDAKATTSDTLDEFAVPVAEVDINDQDLSKAVLKDYAEKDQAITSAATLALDLSAGNTGSVTLDTNVTTLTFTNVPTDGTSSFTLKVTQDGTGNRTMALSGTVNGSSATFKTPAAGGLTLSTGDGDIDLVTFLFFDGDETNVLVNSLLDFS